MKQIFLPFQCLVLCLMLLMACGPESNKSEVEEDDVLPDSLGSTELVMSAEMLCVEEKNAICQFGIRVGEEASFVQLGDYIGDVVVEDAGMVVEDSIENQGGYVWVTRTIQLPNNGGRLVFEGNFIDDRQATDSLLQESTINRIRILSDGYQTAENLGLGSSFGEILEHVGEEGIGFAHLPDFGYVDVQIGQSSIHYLISDQFLPEGAEEIVLEQIPAELPVEMIVVM